MERGHIIREKTCTLHYDFNWKLHRNGDKPAVIHKNKMKEWWTHGKCHRINAPAVIYPDKTYEYFINGNNIQTWLIENDLPFPPNEESWTAAKLRFL